MRRSKQWTVHVISPETRKDLHVIPANTLACDLVFRKGNAIQKGRYVRDAKDQSITWTSLIGGSFDWSHTGIGLPPRSKSFPLISPWSGKRLVSPMQTRQTKMTPIHLETIKSSARQSCCQAWCIFLFPAQWEDTKEIQSLIEMVHSTFRKKKQPLQIVSLGQDIHPVSVSQDVRWAYFQARCHSIAYPLGVHLRFARISLDPDEICDVIDLC